MDIAWLIAGSYLIGSMLTAVLAGRFLFHEDIRRRGSGNPGARNAGRVSGKKAFLAVFVGDALKAVLPVLVSKWLGYPDIVQLSVIAAVMAGHLFPVFHRFRGGQGVSAMIGGLIAYDPVLLLPVLLLFGLLYTGLRHFSAAGLTALSLLPAAAYILHRNAIESAGLSVLIILLLFGHRREIAGLFTRRNEK